METIYYFILKNLFQFNYVYPKTFQAFQLQVNYINKTNKLYKLVEKSSLPFIDILFHLVFANLIFTINFYNFLDLSWLLKIHFSLI